MNLPILPLDLLHSRFRELCRHFDLECRFGSLDIKVSITSSVLLKVGIYQDSYEALIVSSQHFVVIQEGRARKGLQ